MKMIAKFSREGAACYMSHLDLLRWCTAHIEEGQHAVGLFTRL